MVETEDMFYLVEVKDSRRLTDPEVLAKKEKAIKYAVIGAVVSVVMGGISGYLAQTMYGTMLGDDPAPIVAALVRGKENTQVTLELTHVNI